MINKCIYCDPDFEEDFDLDNPINLEILDQQENESIFPIQMSGTSEEPKQPDSVGTTGDLISRQAAIDAMCSVCGNDCDKSKFVYDAPQCEQVILCPEHYALSVLPSVQPDLTKLSQELWAKTCLITGQ